MSEYDEWRAKQDKKKAMCGDVAAPLTTYEARLQNTMDNVTKEQEQKVLDLLHSGLNVGKVAEEVGLDSIVVAKLLQRNIKHYGSFLAKKVTDE